MTTPLVDAFDLVSHGEVLEARLAAAVAELSKCDGLPDEKVWLAAAHRQVARAREGIGDLLTRVLRLPELEPLRGERRRPLQGVVVDAAEHLHAVIVSAASDRSPLLEALYRSFKLPLMRRCHRDDFEAFCVELEKRLGSSYVKRMLADPDYAAIVPAVALLRAAFAEWRSIFASSPPDEAEARGLASELEAVARRLDLAGRQARLLAEAALLPMPALRESSGIFEKPKRRTPRRLEADVGSPADPSAPEREGEGGSSAEADEDAAADEDAPGETGDEDDEASE